MYNEEGLKDLSGRPKSRDEGRGPEREGVGQEMGNSCHESLSGGN
jgi:hypothetical protein